MKDCWKKEPEKRLEFTAIGMRLKDPYHVYDVPPASESEEELEQREEAKEGDENLSSGILQFAVAAKTGFKHLESWAMCVFKLFNYYCNILLPLVEVAPP